MTTEPVPIDEFIAVLMGWEHYRDTHRYLWDWTRTTVGDMERSDGHPPYSSDIALAW